MGIRRRSQHPHATAKATRATRAALEPNGDLDAELLAALPGTLVRRLPGVPPCALFAAYHLARHNASPQRLRHDLGLTGAEAEIVVGHVQSMITES